ncbi:MAG: bamB [Phycisphaerales bacterium]|nr:bamB [Phycisphaerales bacterium]
MTRTRLTLTLLAAALCGCATQTKTQRQVGDIAPGSFEVSWTADTGVKALQQFYYTGDTIFLYDKGNVVSAYDPNGGLKFRTTVGDNGDLLREPMVQPNRIIIPTGGTLELLTQKGVKTQGFVLPQPIRSPGVAVNDFVYFGSDSETGGRLSAVDLTRKYYVNRWTALTGIITTKPALSDGILYCVTDDGRVYAINQDKTPIWGPGPEMPDGIFHTDGKIIAAAKADETGVYVASMDTKLYCLSPNTGHVRWQYFAGAPLTTAAILTSDTCYLQVENKGTVALPKKSGERLVTAKWEFADGAQVVADDAKYAYILTTRGSIAAVNKADGALAFETKRTDIVKAGTSLDPKNPAVYAFTKSGTLICIKPVLKTGVVGELAMLSEK